MSILATVMTALVSAPTCSIHAFSTRPHLPLARVIPLNSRSGMTRGSSLQMAQKMTPTRKTRREDSFGRNAEDGDEKKDEMILDFSEAQAKIKEDENTRRVEEGLTVGLTQEDEEEFNSRKSQYEDMRSKIRDRASSEGIEKSVATKEAIQEATRRAMAGESFATADQMLDLSGFADKFMDDETDELTKEEQAEIDKISSMPLLEQLQEELSNTRFPTPLAIFQTACVMALIFAVSATLVLKGDSIIRNLYMGQGFVPRPEEVYDFSDLNLPDGFLEQQDLENGLESVVQQATNIADQIIPSK